MVSTFIFLRRNKMLDFSQAIRWLELDGYMQFVFSVLQPQH